MRLKHNVDYANLSPQMWYATGHVEFAFNHRGFTTVITSGGDSHENRPNSLHNVGMAADYRTRNVPVSTLALIVSDIKAALDKLGFDVVLESDHLHVEYDPHNGENWLEVTD